MGEQPADDEHRRKKIRPTTREVNGAQFMLRCAELGLSDEDLKLYSMGMIYDMFTEQANDHVKYPFKATQDDITAFLGGD